MRKSFLLPMAAVAVMAQPPIPVEAPGMLVDFVRAEGATFMGKSVKGMPYAAEGVNETVQVLADGNRITRKSSSTVYRDSAGRTRNEHMMPAVGPWASGKGEKMVTIFDPVAKVNITLHPDKTATRMSMPDMASWTVSDHDSKTMTFTKRVDGPKIVRFEPSDSGTVTATATATGTHEIHGAVHDVVIERMGVAKGGMIAMARSGLSSSEGKKSFRREELGKKVIEGVEASGERNVITIEAGEIGNERAIEIVDETWYSKEIEALVYSRHSDPRTGETTYRLTNVRRGEQPVDLFEVPADYKVTDAGKNLEIKMRKKAATNE